MNSENVVTHEVSSSQSIGLMHPGFESLVQVIIQALSRDKLSQLRQDFHTRLRIMLNQPQDSEWIEDLWDFFYDWCVFEQRLVDKLDEHSQKTLWTKISSQNTRGLFAVVRNGNGDMKLKELLSGKSFFVVSRSTNDFLGIEKGDLIEGRLVSEDQKVFSFLRKPSYHPPEVHPYMKKKVKQFKKLKDEQTYQNWLWLLVGMYLKHRIYSQMPIDKIYDDNSRI